MQYLKDGQLFATHSPIYLKPENRVEELLLSPPEQQCAGKTENIHNTIYIEANTGKSQFNPNLHGLWKKY